LSIEEESMRLSYMATNVLNLTKVENQSILSGVTCFNLSEQIRAAVLLLEAKWERKNISFHLDFDEFEIEAGEELLRQVWINLIDNAVKFSPICGEVILDISEKETSYLIKIGNHGAEIPADKLDKIFGKFYQADESHASEGNGVGLAIVKKVVQLHCGSVSASSENGINTFTVELPKQQIWKQK
ncbi:MAG: HAMP domain-containing histidine kinase, partial [Clostridia bacterium]|nr:HAMP domain-containing histidine kinase [Clostridia bacterium]